jgi:hypothetical protein
VQKAQCCLLHETRWAKTAIPWPPRSPDLTTCYLYLWGYVKGQAYQHLMPQTLRELRERISQTTANVNESQLLRAWEEFQYRFDVCRITNGAHIENLQINISSHDVSSYFSFLTVTDSKIHLFLSTETIYNSPVLSDVSSNGWWYGWRMRLTPWNWALLEKPPVGKLVKNLQPCYVTQSVFRYCPGFW